MAASVQDAHVAANAIKESAEAFRAALDAAIEHEKQERSRRIDVWIFIVGYLAYEPWLLMTMWRWFVAPLGAPSVGYWQMAGINLIAGSFTYRYKPKKPDAKTLEDATIDRWCYGIATLILAFAFSFGVAQ